MGAIVVVADLGGSPKVGGDPWLRVPAGELPGLFTTLRPTLRLRTPDLLTGAERDVDWTLTLRSLRDLDPESLLAAFPPAAELFTWRKRLLDVVSSGTGAPGLLDALERLWPDVPPSASETAGAGPVAADPSDEVDVLLASVEGPAGTPAAKAPTGTGLRGRLLPSFRVLSLPMAERLRQACTATDEALGRQLQAILHDPAFRDVEIAWRQLWAIAEVADLRRGDLRLHVLPCVREQASESLADLCRFMEEGREERPEVSRVVVDHPVGSDEASRAILDEAGALALSLNGVAFVPLDPGFLARGASHERGEPRPAAEWLGSAEVEAILGARRGLRHGRVLVTCNRFMGRPGCVPEEGFTTLRGIRENLDSGSGPYANAVWIAARGLAAAVRRAGADAFASLDAEVGSIPTRPLGDPVDPTHVLPLEFYLTPDDAGRILSAGIAPLTAPFDRDVVTLRVPVISGTVDKAREAAPTANYPEPFGLRATLRIEPPNEHGDQRKH